MALTSVVVTELANTMMYGGRGSYLTLFSPSSHSKLFPVTSQRFTELVGDVSVLALRRRLFKPRGSSSSVR